MNTWKEKISSSDPRNREGYIKLLFLSNVVGILAAVAAIVLRATIGFAHNALFLGEFSFTNDPTAYIVTNRGYYVVLLPMIGFLLTALLGKIAPETRSAGIPEVMEAIMKDGGKIRPRVAPIKAIASGLTIGSGGSAGREGPIVQTAASLASSVGQLFKLPASDMIVLVSCGAAGGIAATFNAPIAGALFAIELLLPQLTTLNVLPLFMSTAIAAFIGRSVLGNSPSFNIPSFHLQSGWELIFYAVLGVVSAIAAGIFVKTLGRFDRFFNRDKFPSFLKPISAGLLVGIIGLCFWVFSPTGQFHVFGVGYDTLSDIFLGARLPLGVLLTLVIAKIAVTSLTIGSGGSGGIFAPSLFIGGTVGAAFGVIVNRICPAVTAEPAAYALVGMAAVTAGTTRATLAAIVIIFEMTLNYSIILPLMLASVIADVIFFKVFHESIYDMKLQPKGIHVDLGRSLDLSRLIPAGEVMSTPVIVLDWDETLQSALQRFRVDKIHYYPIVKDNFPTKIIDLGRVDYTVPKDTPVHEITDTEPILVEPKTLLYDVIEQMDDRDQGVALVIENNRLVGIITRRDIMQGIARKRNLLFT